MNENPNDVERRLVDTRRGLIRLRAHIEVQNKIILYLLSSFGQVREQREDLLRLVDSHLAALREAEKEDRIPDSPAELGREEVLSTLNAYRQEILRYPLSNP